MPEILTDPSYPTVNHFANLILTSFAGGGPNRYVLQKVRVALRAADHHDIVAVALALWVPSPAFRSIFAIFHHESARTHFV